MPKVAPKRGRKPAAKAKSRVSRRQNVGALEALGARLDSSAGILAAGALNLVFIAIVVGGLALLAVSAVSGRLESAPERFAMLPETVTRAAGFNVMRVTVKGGDELTTREIMNALADPVHGSVVGRSLLAVDVAELRNRVEGLGPVHAAAVQKLFPNTIHVSIIERQPRALYQNADGTFSVVDASGEVISKAHATEHT
ncbi:MAG: FtsQ-type POTRA domain-containing protein, partial [Parvularcula sp.]|nr:FtsQ-type POTRA domain-containing protein [Parvularcula sp.]